MPTTPGSLEKEDVNNIEHLDRSSSGRTPDDAQILTDDEEPELHMKTWLALAAMCILQYVTLLALVGPPTAVGYTQQHSHSRLTRETDKQLTFAMNDSSITLVRRSRHKSNGGTGYRMQSHSCKQLSVLS